MNFINVVKSKWREEKLAMSSFLVIALIIVFNSRTSLVTNSLASVVPDNSLTVVLLIGLAISGLAIFRRDI